MSEERRIARRYYVSGSVQGVGYRHWTRRSAEALGVAGYAKNLRDGRVEVYAIGTAEKLQALREKLEMGPAAAAVWEVQEQLADFLPRFGNEFAIEHEGW